MKKKNKKNHIRMRFSTLLLCCLAFVLCAAPRGWADVVLYDGKEHKVEEDIIGYLSIGNGTTVNLYASVEQYVSVGPYSVLNIYSGGSVGDSVYLGRGSVLNIYSGNVGGFISISPDEPYAVVTVYGTDFKDELGPVNYGQWTPDAKETLTGQYDAKETLTGQYKDGSSINLWVWSNIAINLKPPPTEEIQIDIKPGSDDNSINLKSKGVVPVAVFTIAGGLDAGTINPDTVLFAGASPERWKLCDVDGDADDDRLFHFKTENLVELDVNSTVATLTGKTFGGDDIELTDEVRIVPQKKKK